VNTEKWVEKSPIELMRGEWKYTNFVLVKRMIEEENRNAFQGRILMSFTFCIHL
jgi:hypothetical protein